MPPGILLHPLSASSLLRSLNSTQYDLYPSATKTINRSRGFKLKATSSPSSFAVTDFDLYDLLGIDSTSSQSQIKTAYRSLQKRCHPDIAGPTGHEMAIILNEVYSILSDPVSRSVYDEEQAKMAEFQGYSGKPLYSTWRGSENEERAVFVDEVTCVGCLKCALLADKTFAIESVYGRARVIAQWADPEDKILDAIEACPVDCISMVKRSNLAALEFLMSKQPRVKIGTTVTKGMVDVKKFQTKLQQAKDRESIPDPRETAFHTIRSISNWFYWQSPNGGDHGRSLMRIAGSSSRFHTDKLRDAAAAARQGFWQPLSAKRKYKFDSDDDKEEYWAPLDPVFVPQSSPLDNLNPNRATTDATPTPSTSTKLPELKEYGDQRRRFSLRWSSPLAIATLAAAIVRLQVGETSNTGVDQHITGPLPLEIVNSSWLQAILAGCTWYLIGFVCLELLMSITSRK